MYAAYDGLDDERARIASTACARCTTSPTPSAVSSMGDALARQAGGVPARRAPGRADPSGDRPQGIVRERGLHLARRRPAPRDESKQLLDLLYRQATVPEYQCRFHWRPDWIAFWDNRAVQHYAVSDYWPQHRVMERVTVIGDTPV